MSEFRSPDYSADAVVAQDPAPSARAPQVSLLLNRGETATTYVMPDLIGTNGERAAETLRTRGFRVTIVGSQPYAGRAARAQSCASSRPAAFVSDRQIPFRSR